MPLAPFSSPFARILAAIVSRAAAGLRIDSQFVTPVANDKYDVTVSETLFAYVQAFGIQEPRDPALSFENAGAGNLGRPVARRVRFYVYTRAGFDVYGSDTVALEGADPTQTVLSLPVFPGAFAAEDLLFSKLSDWTPLSGSTPLTIGPLHPLPAESGPPLRKPEDEEGLLRSALDFEVVYIVPQVSDEPNL